MDDPRSPARVRLLDATVANQIAAGEVVERPASVLKELVENSLDAGAGALDVDLERGGARLIRVRDDGLGIHPDDLSLALSRHGTSKLGRLEDLDRLSTLGFRGEALASIASVSRFTLRSRIAAQPTGWTLDAGQDRGRDRGAQGGPAPVAMPPGTVVEVRDLFFNTPARRRFLRTERTELGHLEAVLRHAALSRFDVALVARHDGRRLLSVRPVRPEDAPEGRRRRLAAILGRSFAERARWLETEVPGMRLTGWVLPAAAASTTTFGQCFFLNRRAIRDPVVRHALGSAHEGLLLPGQQPSYVLYLDLPGEQVDVNVHPTKSEVRFREARSVHDFLLAAVRRALGDADADLGGSRRRAGEEAGRRPAEGSPSPPGGRAGSLAGGVYPGGEGRPAGRRSAVRDAPAPDLHRGLRGESRRGSVLVEGRYLLFEDAAGPVLLDVRATLERAAGQVLRRALEHEPLVGRPLLLPPARPVGAGAAERLMERAPLLARLGVALRRVGGDEVSLRELPHLLARTDAAVLLESLAANAGAEPDTLAGILASAAGAAPAGGRAGERDDEPETRAAVLEAYRVLTEGGTEPGPPWGRRLGARVLARWLEGEG